MEKDDFFTNENDLINKYSNLVKSIAFLYKNTGIPIEDLTQEGLIGLLEARKRYDSEKGASFSTYASFWIKNRMLSLISKEIKQNAGAEYNDSTSIDSNLESPVEKAYLENKKSKQLSLPDDMPDIEKQILKLSFVEKKSLNEIANLLNLSREKTRQLKSKAMRRFKSETIKND